MLPKNVGFLCGFLLYYTNCPNLNCIRQKIGQCTPLIVGAHQHTRGFPPAHQRSCPKVPYTADWTRRMKFPNTNEFSNMPFYVANESWLNKIVFDILKQEFGDLCFVLIAFFSFPRVTDGVSLWRLELTENDIENYVSI